MLPDHTCTNARARARTHTHTHTQTHTHTHTDTHTREQHNGLRGSDFLHDHRGDVVLVVSLETVQKLHVVEELERRSPEVLHHLARVRIHFALTLDTQHHTDRLHDQLDDWRWTLSITRHYTYRLHDQLDDWRWTLSITKHHTDRLHDQLDDCRWTLSITKQ